MATHAGSTFMQQNWTPDWEGLWVAASATRVVGENSNYDELIQYLKAEHPQLQDIAIAFFPRGIFQ